MYIPPFIFGVICGVVGTIVLEVVACVIYFRKSEKNKPEREDAAQ